MNPPPTPSTHSGFRQTDWLRRWAWLGCLCVLLAMLPSLAWASPLVLEPRSTGLSTAGHLLHWRDASGRATFDEVWQPTHDPQFQPPTGKVRAKADGAAHWFKLQIQQPEPDGDWVVAMSSTAAREVTFWGPFNAQGQALSEPVVTGLSHPYPSRPLGSERYVQHLRLPDAGVYTVYWRVVSDVPVAVEPMVWDTGTFLYWRGHKRLFDGICYGILLALLVYNLALAGVFKDRTYALYVLSCGFALLTLATFNGHTAHYLWPGHPWWIEHSYTVFAALWLGCNGLFARQFLNTRVWAPKLDWLIHAVLLGAIAGLGLGVAGLTAWAQMVNEVTAFVGVWLITATALWVWRRGYSPALWYLAGQLALFVAVVALVLVNWNALDAPWIQANALQAGVALELAGFAIALGARIRLLERQQTELRVHARHLAQQATTDPLTGTANRAGLAQAAEHVLQQPAPCALLLLDLNQFKAINDTYGHEAGDVVLRAVAQRLGAELRKSDTVARLGGDEFVVLLQATPDELLHTVPRLSRAVNQPLAYGDHTLDVRASVGVALSPRDGTDLTRLLKAADQAMYQAKQRGDSFAFYDGDPDEPPPNGPASPLGAGI